MNEQHAQRRDGRGSDHGSDTIGPALWSVGFSTEREGGLVAVYAALIAADRATARAEFDKRLEADVDEDAIVRGLEAADPFAELLLTEALAAEIRRVAAAPDDLRHHGYWVRLERAFVP